MKRITKIVVFGLIGAFIGSSVGIVAMGSGIAGTVPLGLLMAFITYLLTKPKNNDAEDGLMKSISKEAVNDKTPKALPIEDIGKAINQTIPAITLFLCAAWNLTMQGLITVGLMPLFRELPWLLGVLIFGLIIFGAPIGIFLCVAGIVALKYDMRAENSFIVTAHKGHFDDNIHR